MNVRRRQLACDCRIVPYTPGVLREHGTDLRHLEVMKEQTMRMRHLEG